MNLTTPWDRFYLCVEDYSSLWSSPHPWLHAVCVCIPVHLCKSVCLRLNDDAFTSCYTLSGSGHNTGLCELCLWDKHLLSSFIILSSGRGDSAISYVKPQWTVKAAAEHLCFAFHWLLHLSPTVLIFMWTWKVFIFRESDKSHCIVAGEKYLNSFY